MFLECRKKHSLIVAVAPSRPVPPAHPRRVWQPAVRAGRGVHLCQLYGGHPVRGGLSHQPGCRAMPCAANQGVCVCVCVCVIMPLVAHACVRACCASWARDVAHQGAFVLALVACFQWVQSTCVGCCGRVVILVNVGVQASPEQRGFILLAQLISGSQACGDSVTPGREWDVMLQVCR